MATVRKREYGAVRNLIGLSPLYFANEEAEAQEQKMVYPKSHS